MTPTGSLTASLALQTHLRSSENQTPSATGQTRMPRSLLTAQALRADAPVTFSAFWDVLEQHDELEALKPDSTLHAAAARSMASTDVTIAKVSDQLVGLTRMVRQMCQALRAGANPQRRAPPTKEVCRDCLNGRCHNRNCPRQRAPRPPTNRHHAAVVCTLPVAKSPTANAAHSTPTEQAQAAAL